MAIACPKMVAATVAAASGIMRVRATVQTSLPAGRLANPAGSQAGKPATERSIRKVGWTPGERAAARRRRGSESLLASCWPRRTGNVEGKKKSRGAGRLVRLVVSPEPKQESSARDHASDDAGNRFCEGLQRAAGREQLVSSTSGLCTFASIRQPKYMQERRSLWRIVEVSAG